MKGLQVLNKIKMTKIYTPGEELELKSKLAKAMLCPVNQYFADGSTFSDWLFLNLNKDPIFLISADKLTSGRDSFYEEFIVSTQEHCTFLHRCSERILERVLREGLDTSSNLLATASAQPMELEEAKQAYRNGQGYGNKVAVIHIPRKLWEVARRKSPMNQMATRELGYFHPHRRTYTLKPEFIVASINRETDELAINPNVVRKPVMGHEAFDYMFD